MHHTPLWRFVRKIMKYEDVTLYNFELNPSFSGVEESKATLKLLK
jgi:hypothetical protein